MACQFPMVNFVTLIPPHIQQTPQSPTAMPHSSKIKINTFCILLVINQTHDKAVNTNDNFWTITTLQNNKKFYIICLQFSYSLALHFPYDIIYLLDGCKANTITFVLPSNNQLSIDSIIKGSENKLGFNRSYSKIDNFSLMQSLNISSINDIMLQALAPKIPKMEHLSVFSINNTLT